MVTPVAASVTLPSKPHACVPWNEADCHEKCQRGSAANCRLLSSFYTYYARGATESLHPAPEMKAKATDALQRAVSLDARACDEGDLSACDGLQDMSMYPALPPEVRARTQERAGELRREVRRAQGADCDGGSISACEALLKSGMLHGEVLAANHHRVVEHYRAACSSGDGDACLTAGRWLGDDQVNGVAPSWPDAMDLLQRACDAGNEDGCSDLSVHLAHQAKDGGGEEASRLMVRSEALWRRTLTLRDELCHKGQPKACARLAQVLAAGDRVPADPRRAFFLFRRGCDLGSGDVCLSMFQRYVMADEPEPTGLTKEEDKEMAPQLRSYVRYEVDRCKEGDASMCDRIDPSWLSGHDDGSVEGIAKMFCQRFDYPGINCQADTNYFNVFCRYYCVDGEGISVAK